MVGWGDGGGAAVGRGRGFLGSITGPGMGSAFGDMSTVIPPKLRRFHPRFALDGRSGRRGCRILDGDGASAIFLEWRRCRRAPTFRKPLSES